VQSRWERRCGRAGVEPQRAVPGHITHISAVQPAQDRAGGVASRVSRVCYRLGPVSRVRMYSSVINTLWTMRSYGISYAKRHIPVSPPTARVACGAGHAPSTVLRDTHDGAIGRERIQRKELSRGHGSTQAAVEKRKKAGCSRPDGAIPPTSATASTALCEPTLLAIVASGRA